MSIFAKYEPYLDREKAEKGGYSQLVITNLASKYNDKSPTYKSFEEYVESLDGDLGYFEVLRKSGNRNNRNNNDYSDLENIVAFLAINGLWENINSKYSKNEDLDKALENKEELKNIDYNYTQAPKLSDDVKNRFEKKGLKLVELTDIELGISAFNSLLSLENNLSEDNSELKRAETLKRIYDGSLRSFKTSMMGVLEGLYSTGFNGFGQEGVLVNHKEGKSPILKIDYKHNVIRSKLIDGGTVNDNKINNSVLNTYPFLNNYYMTTTESKEDVEYVPNIDYFMSSKEPFVCVELHLQFQTANIRFSKGKTAISKWIKETTNMSVDEWISKCNNNNNAIQKWKDVKKWYNWALEKIFIDALLQYKNGDTKLMGTGSFDEIEIVDTIQDRLLFGLRNIVVVSERDNSKFANIELRLSSYNNLEYEVLRETLDNSLNPKGAGEKIVDFKEKSKNNNNIVLLEVIFNKAEANKANLFAGDVIDKFIESGNIPSWGNALIGKKMDASLFFWDGFMDPAKAGPANRCYTIYAGSRSGKGVMTSTLIASALCDKRQVFYTDGKPENGAVMGRIAWEEHKEAYVFDGQAKGSLPFSGDMEDYTYNVRNSNETLAYLDKLPPDLFGTFNSDELRNFFGVMRYLKSLNLCADIINARSAGELEKDNWQIWVFDEMTKMSNNEKSVRELFAKYCMKIEPSCCTVSSKRYIKGIKPGTKYCDKNSMDYDEGIDFISKWCSWCEKLKDKALTMSTISLGKSNANLIFIFQNASWISTDKEITIIGGVVDGLKSTKIVGRSGIASECGDYGDGNTRKKPWYQEVNVEGACKWAMSHGEDIRSCEVTLFKPFNIWTLPITKSEEIDYEKANNMDDSESVRYFKGYVTKLLNTFNIDPAEVIESAYLYADEAVKTLGLNELSVKDYIYDCSDLSIKLGNGMEDLSKEIGKESSGGFAFNIEEETNEDTDDSSKGNNTQENPIGESTQENPIGEDTQENPIGESTQENPIGDADSQPQEVDKRLETVYELNDSKYVEIINKIEKKKTDLENMPRVEKNQPKFTSLKAEVLRNFNGVYKTERIKFLNGLKVSNVRLKAEVDARYNNMFDSDFTRLKNEIQAIDFVVVPKDTGGNTENKNPLQQNGGDNKPAEQRGNGSPIQQQGTNSPNNRGSSINGRQINSPIQSDDIGIDRNNIDSISNVIATDKLTSRIINDIKVQFGGINGIESLNITANGCLVVNGYTYIPQLDTKFMDTLGAAVKLEVEEGQIYKIVNIGRVVRETMKNIFELSIETPKVAYSNAFKSEIGVSNNYGVLFNKLPNLQTIYLPDEELTRNNPNSQSQNSGGIGSKIAKFFSFGRGNSDNSNYTPNPAPEYSGNDTFDRIMESKPVRILTGALGWTLGVKTVCLAATLFGPWGMLFGAFAAYGAYKEMKNPSNNNNNYSSNRQRNNSNNRSNNTRSSNGNRNSNGGRNTNNSRNNSRNNNSRRNNDDDGWN